MPRITFAAVAALAAPTSQDPAQAPGPAPASATIVGRVFGQDGEPVRGAEVWATEPDAGDAVVRRTRTDGEGVFVLGRLPTTLLLVRATAKGMTAAASRPRAANGSGEASVDLTLWEARTLRGRVLAADDQPIAGASLLATKDAMRAGIQPCEGRTDAEGRFELHGVPLGECTLRALAPGFALGEATFWAADDERADLRLRRIDGTRITVTSEGLDGAAAAGTRVVLRMRSVLSTMPHLADVHRLGADGTCTVEGLPESSWTVALQHPDFRFEPSEAGVPSSVDPAAIHFAARPIATTVQRGRLLADGAPLAGQTVRLWTGAARTTGPLLATTDAEGRFAIATRLRRDSAIAFELEGPSWALLPSASGPLGDTLQPDRELSLQAVRAVPVGGRVVDASGNGVAFQEVVLQAGGEQRGDARWSTIRRTTSRRDGSFAFEGVVPGDFELRIVAQGPHAHGATPSFEVRGGAPPRQQLATTRSARLEGILAGADGKPLVGWVVATPAETTMTGRDGRYLFRAVQPGTCSLSVVRPGSTDRHHEGPFELAAGETHRQDLRWQ